MQTELEDQNQPQSETSDGLTPKSPHRRLVIGLLLFPLVILVIGLIIFWLKPKKATSPTLTVSSKSSDATSQPTTSITATLAPVPTYPLLPPLEELRTSVTKQILTVEARDTQNDRPAFGGKSPNYPYNIGFEIPGKNFLEFWTAGTGVSSGSEQQVLDMVNQYFEAHGYQKLDRKTATADGSPYIVREWSKQDEVCYPDGFGAGVRISCTTRTDIEAASKDALLFYEAAMRAGKTPGSLGRPVIKDSQTVGYRLASSGLDNAVGLFYEKNGDWYLFTATQSILPCDDYKKSDDVHKAYLGAACQTGDQAAKVQ